MGGWRRARKDSPNTALRTPGFRGYADYMLTGEFQRVLDGLLELARRQRTAIMCAELVPQRCHRSFIADAFTARSAEVYHLLEKDRTQQHALRALARVNNGLVTYPPQRRRGSAERGQECSGSAGTGNACALQCGCQDIGQGTSPEGGG